MSEEELDELNAAGRAQWERKAEFWDQLHGDAGNSFSRHMVEPSVQALLELEAGERVVEAACGSGNISRRLAAWGARLTAFDFCEGLVERARARAKAGTHEIDHRCVDATDELAIRGLGEGEFDAAVCTMALMDMPAVAPLYRGLFALLRPGGRFVFATSHPVFDTAGPRRVSEKWDEDGVLRERRSLQLSAYLEVPPTRAVGARREPSPHNFYHRSFTELFAPAFEAGFVLDALREPAFGRPGSDPGPEVDDFWQFPPVLAGRWIKPG